MKKFWMVVSMENKRPERYSSKEMAVAAAQKRQMNNVSIPFVVMEAVVSTIPPTSAVQLKEIDDGI